MVICPSESKNKLFAITFALAFLWSILAPTTLLYSESGILPPQKGMCYVTWDKDRFASEYSDRSLEKLANIGVDYISVVVTQYQEKHTSTDIKRMENTPSDKSLEHVIKKSHDLGLKTMLKPHIDLIGGFDSECWRADIGFTDEKDWEKWFREYRKFILHYARMADRLGIEILCIGTELSFSTQKNSFWRETISDIRKVYNGKLVYASNWDNYKAIEFWQDLDYVGIDAYFPLTCESDPSVEDLIKAWEKWKHEIEIWQVKVNKPIIFTEIGYPSASHAPSSPWENGMEGDPAPHLQAKCYEAFFASIWKCPWLKGVYWWKWDTNIYAGGENNRHFTPQNKPAERVLEAHYKGYRKDATYAMAD